ncbi:MAG: prephenate dehydratase [Opitutales bacterium]|nr:prephenate dehydratase [Opitutales bacterium]MCH8541134.1 prephenate dehydratase [Opitutales bacterium]
MSDELTPHREKIDALDQQLVKLFNERLESAAAIGEIKKQQGAPIYVPEREEEVFRKVCQHNQGKLPNAALRAIYREIMSAAIALEKETIIAFLGPEATFTHQAALRKFGVSLHYKALPSIADVFHLVESGEADYGVIPIENSTEGAVFHSLDMLVDSDLKIVSQLYLEIKHALLTEQTDLSKIQEVYSKDQAIGQCRHWLQTNLPQARLVDTASTAHAVQLVKDRPECAAIASTLAGEMHGVPVLRESIQDKSDNITRFLIVGKQPTAPTSTESKTSIVISINDEVGALQKAIAPFSSRKLNLCKIESRPSRKRPWDYYFFIDFIGHHDEPKVQEALQDLRRICPLVKWLGSYPNIS